MAEMACARIISLIFKTEAAEDFDFDFDSVLRIAEDLVIE
jgi:hypothetical protein